MSDLLSRPDPSLAPTADFGLAGGTPDSLLGRLVLPADDPGAAAPESLYVIVRDEAAEVVLAPLAPAGSPPAAADWTPLPGAIRATKLLMTGGPALFFAATQAYALCGDNPWC